jgi:hypothetical protein
VRAYAEKKKTGVKYAADWREVAPRCETNWCELWDGHR